MDANQGEVNLAIVEVCAVGSIEMVEEWVDEGYKKWTKEIRE